MTHKRRTATLVALALAFAAPRADAYTHKYYAWTTASTECPTTSGSLSAMDDMLDAWSDKMIDKGWPRDGKLVNGNINLDRFCDPDSGISGCSDYTNGIDEADAVMVGVHGSDDGDHWEGLLRDSGTSGSSCRANNSDDLRPDVDLEFLHLVSCHSLDDDNLPYAWEMMQDPVDSPGNGRRLQLLTGFHGNTGIGTSLTGEYKQVAKDGFKGALSDAWMDNLYDPSVTYVGTAGVWEMCPIAYTIGSTSNLCTNLLDDTGYGSVGFDPSNDTYYCYTYMEDCLPSGDDVFDPL